MPQRRWRHGNMASIKNNLGNARNNRDLILASCQTVYQDSATGFYRVNCVDTRRGTPYQNVQVATAVKPLPLSMGLLIFADGDVSLPLFLPLGW